MGSIVRDVMKFIRLAVVIAAIFLRGGFPGQAWGQVWTSTNIFNNWTSIAMTSDGSKIAAAGNLGGIYTSLNSGASWANGGSPAFGQPVLATSTNGNNLVAAFFNGQIFTSPNWGQGWTPSLAPVDDWNCLASSWDGTRLAAGTSPGPIYVSSDSGATFTTRLPQNDYQAMAASADGTLLVAAVFGGGIYYSVNAGDTWAATAAPSAYWSAIASSSNGMNLAAAIQGGGIYTSTNSGYSWAPSGALVTNWSAIASSADGSKLVAVVNGGIYFGGGVVYTSTNFGSTWAQSVMAWTNEAFVTNVMVINNTQVTNVMEVTNVAELISAYWTAVYSSSDGSGLVAMANGGGFNGGLIYYSTNEGGTWGMANAPLTNWTSIASVANNGTLIGTTSGGYTYYVTNYTVVGKTTNIVLIPTVSVGSLYTSTNAGVSWQLNGLSSQTNNTPNQNWAAAAASADGTMVVAAGANGGIYTSTNFFTATNASAWVSNSVPSQNWSAVYASANGNTLVALARSGWSYKSTNAGASWSQLSAPSDFWESIASSADGNDLVAAPAFGVLFRSTDAGMTWQALNTAISTNIVVTNLVTAIVQGTNINNNVISFSATHVTFVSTNAVNTSTVSFAAAEGFNLLGTNMAGNNVVLLTNSFGFSLPGTNAFVTNIVSTVSLGTNALGIGGVVPTTVGTNVYLNTLSIPQAPDLTSVIVTNPIGLLSTAYLASASLSVSNINVTVSDSIEVNVQIVNVRQPWSAVASSADGTVLAAAVNGGNIYISTDSGAAWAVAGAPSTNWLSIACSADGTTVVALASDGSIYSSFNSGATWTGTNVLGGTAPTETNGVVASSANGSVLFAAFYGSFLYADPPKPKLQVSADGSNVILTWPTTMAGYSVQENSDGYKTPWANLAATAIVTNGQYEVIVPMSGGYSSYRLKK